MPGASIARLYGYQASPAEHGDPGGLQHILRAIRTHLGMDVALVSRVAPDAVTIIDADHKGEALLKPGERFVPEDGYCKRIVDGRIPYLIRDTSQVAEVADLECTKAMKIGAHISVPIRLGDGQVFGTFCCFRHTPDQTLTDRDLQMMHAFAELAAAQIDGRIRQDERTEQTRHRITRVIEQNQLAVVLQPIFRLGSDEIAGVETLSRFDDSETRSPQEWFAEAREIGLGLDLEMAAFRAGTAALPYLPPSCYLAINVSPEALISGEVERALAEVPPGRVVLEITEHAIVESYAALRTALSGLRSKARIAIDDAGAGYSGLKHILEVEPDLIKLDIALTRGIDSDPARYALAAALTTFAREIGSQIVAEGIETASELETLRRLGVSFGQGYFLARPMPAAAVSRLLIANRI